MKGKLIDTNVFIDSLRNQEKAIEFLRNEPELLCSVITAGELIAGARDKTAQVKIERALEDLRILPLSEKTGDIMLDLLKDFHLSHGLQIPDALIAATALEADLMLVTSNIRHFSFISSLKLFDWTKA